MDVCVDVDEWGGGGEGTMDECMVVLVIDGCEMVGWRWMDRCVGWIDVRLDDGCL